MKRLLPILAGLGAAIAIAVVLLDHRPPSTAAPLIPAPRSPFASFVAGAGILEPSTWNIAVAAPVPGIVSDVPVTANDRVKAGDVLFKLDDRDLQARLATAIAAVRSAQAVERKARHHLEVAERLQGTAIISEDEMARRRDDAAIAAAAVAVAKAHENEIRTDIERRTVRAPVAGRVLKVNVRKGELDLANGSAAPPVLLGDDDKLYVRVDVDENDAWRVRPGATATAFVRGVPTVEIPLEFVRIEPYVTPKTSFTGLGTERTDVRVLQVIYGFARGSRPVYDGQQVDVFIEAPPVGSGAE